LTTVVNVTRAGRRRSPAGARSRHRAEAIAASPAVAAMAAGQPRRKMQRRREQRELRFGAGGTRGGRREWGKQIKSRRVRFGWGRRGKKEIGEIYLLRGLLQIVREGGPEGGEERGVRSVPHEEREWFHCHGCFCLLIAAAAASGVASCVYVEGGERGGNLRGGREKYI